MIAYHGIHPEDLDSVLARGLLVSKTNWAREERFWHLSFAETPGVARWHGIVLEANLAGLDLPEEGFVGGELRMHENIAPERLRVLEPQPAIDRTGFIDPGKTARGQHPTCLRLRCWERQPSRSN